MTGATTVYRADVIGSMLRPHELADARAAHRRGELSRDQLRAVEDSAVDQALRIQEEAGVDVVTDGEMRRDIFFDFFASGLEGLVPHPGWTVRFHSVPGDDAFQVQMPFAVTEKVRPRSSPALAEFEYARPRTRLSVKVTVPSPTLISAFWAREVSADAYPDVFDLIADVVDIVKHWIVELAQAGCRYIQVDAPELNEVYADPAVRQDYIERGISPERYMKEGAAYLNEVTKVDLPGGTLLGLHVCKGNGTQSWIAQGGYEDIARDVFRYADGFDVFLLEYDDERSGSFEPLRHLPNDKVAVLGMVSTKWTALEDPDMLRRRVREASEYFPLDRLALATQCGFASAAEVAEQRMITEETQAQKLRLVAQTARSLWGDGERA